MRYVGALVPCRAAAAAMTAGALALGLSVASLTAPTVASASPADATTDPETTPRAETHRSPGPRRGATDREPRAVTAGQAVAAPPQTVRAGPKPADTPPQVAKTGAAVALGRAPSSGPRALAGTVAPRAPQTQQAAEAAATSLSPVAGATAALPANPIGDLINGVLTLVRRLLFNQAPSAAPVQAMTRPNGQIWGFVAGSDPEGDRITYSLNRRPQFGTVTVNANGVYTYTPGVGFSGTDAFTVTVDDPGLRINLLNLFGSHRRNVTVSVKTSPGTPSGSVVDTFDGPVNAKPNPALWGYHLGPLRDDGLQTYTDASDNVRLDGQGNLIIQARQTPDGYTSTRLVTQDKLAMQYGVVQARIKLPAGQGIWPAFWMLGTSYRPEQPEGWPACGEIDIMEVVNTGTNYTVALHGPQGDTDYYGGAEASGRFVGRQGPISAVAPISDLSADYHDYWLMWRQDQIVIGVDDTMLGDFTPASLPEGGEWVFNQPMYAILQIAVGGPWPGPPDATTPWPATMLVDSFRYTPLS